MTEKCHICKLWEPADDCDGGICGEATPYACENLEAWLAIEAYTKDFPVPPIYREARFGDLPADATPEQAKTIRALHDVHAKALDERKNVVSCGEMGLGKTYAAAATVNEAHLRRISAIFTDVTHALNLMREYAKTNDGYQWIISDLSTVPVLVMDDMGRQRNTDFAVESIWSIINTRHLNGRMTIVTTNLMPNQFGEMGDTMEKLLDRLCENGMLRKVSGQSMRIPE